MNESVKFIIRKIKCILGSVTYGLYFLQTPVFRGEEEDRLEDAKHFVLRLLGSETFIITTLGIGIAIGAWILYNRKKTISELEIRVIKEDTWFATRGDNNRLCIVVSANLMNRSTRGIYITNCKISGYSPKESPQYIPMDGLEESQQEQKLKLPQYKNFFKGQEFYLGPYSSETLWFYYESRSMTMANLLETSLSIRDSRKKRKSIRLSIPRHADQIAIYRDMARIW